MSPSVVQLQLDAYLSTREALGFQMRAERTLLREFGFCRNFSLRRFTV